jgi:hypothetical protein
MKWTRRERRESDNRKNEIRKKRMEKGLRHVERLLDGDLQQVKRPKDSEK